MQPGSGTHYKIILCELLVPPKITFNYVADKEKKEIMYCETFDQRLIPGCLYLFSEIILFIIALFPRH